jgi:hypothetical protein
MAILRLQQSIQRAPDFRGYMPLFIKALVTPQSMIEEISLPGDFRDSSRDPLKSRIRLESCAFPGTPVSMCR